MFIDNVVLAGIVTVALMVVFVAWFGVIAYKHIKQDKPR